jgi:hypothetical protein
MARMTTARLLGEPARFVGQQIDEQWMELSFREDTAAAAGELHDPLGLAAEDGGERVVDRGQQQHLAEIVAFERAVVPAAARCVAERLVVAARAAELVRNLEQVGRLPTGEVAPAEADGVPKRVAKAEVVKERDHIREPLVEGRHVGAARREELRP